MKQTNENAASHRIPGEMLEGMMGVSDKVQIFPTLYGCLKSCVRFHF
jgi:hypothetical protein